MNLGTNKSGFGGKAEFKPIEDGKYSVSVEKVSQGIKSKTSDSEYTEAVLVIKDEQYKNRKVWARFMTRHGNQKAVSVGMDRLRQFIEASGGSGFYNEIIEGNRDIGSLEGKTLSVTLQTKGKFTNVNQFLAA